MCLEGLPDDVPSTSGIFVSRVVSRVVICLSLVLWREACGEGGGSSEGSNRSEAGSRGGLEGVGFVYRWDRPLRGTVGP